MLKKKFHIFIALLLVVATSSSVWGQFIVEKDSIEISEQLEKDAENSEKEFKEKLEGWDSQAVIPSSFNPELCSGFLKSGSSSFAPSTLLPKKLFIVFGQLKIHC